ncbi:macro domain-containing protein [Candidatus Microgenomates bacterium]|nr:macro domain-containing protein [Candidatus Microgenomates bacterium]
MQEVISDITKLRVDVIVNAANTQLKHMGGVAAAIAKAGGPSINQESAKIGFVPIGQIAVTGAGSLAARYVIHIPTIDYTTGTKATLEDITRALRAAFAKAIALRTKTVAVPLLGAGVVGLPESKIKAITKQVADEFPELDIMLCIHK